MRAAPTAVIAGSLGGFAVAAAVLLLGQEDGAIQIVAALFGGAVALLCVMLGVMRWTMHRAASRERVVW
ncbi:MAG: hypothetical protein AAF916_07815 [Planctomycetota bacterium]